MTQVVPSLNTLHPQDVSKLSKAPQNHSTQVTIPPKMSPDLLKQFQKILQTSKNIIVLTGAGISAESGIPVFRGAGGVWRNYKSEKVATPEAFKANPSLVWEFYHYRREVAFAAQPNAAHIALGQFEKECARTGKQFTIITQNVDGLHHRAGSQHVLELHGSLRKVRCTKCGHVEVDLRQPICEALNGRGDPNLKTDLPKIPLELLPKCGKCKALARPHIVWFGEQLEHEVLQKAHTLVSSCDLCLVVGTSSVVYPAAMFAPTCAERGVPVAEFNVNERPASDIFKFYFAGPCGTTLPKALNIDV